MSELQDVRDFLRKSLCELADSDASAEEMRLKIERAKATSIVAGSIVQTIKLECDAIRLAEATGMLPESIGAPVKLRPALRAIGGRE